MRNILFAALLLTTACTAKTPDTTTDTTRVIVDTSVTPKDTLVDTARTPRCGTKIICDSTTM